MNILHINSYSLQGKFYKNMTDRMFKLGYNSKVYVPTLKKSSSSATEIGNYYDISACYNSLDRYFFVSKHRKIFVDIQKKYNINDFDLIHAHSLFSNGFIALKLFNRYSIPYVVAIRDTDVNLFFKKFFFLRKLGFEIMNNAKKIIFISQSYREQVIDKYVPSTFKDAFFQKSVVIPNGIDKFWLENKNNEKKLATSTLNLLSVGELTKRKNFLKTIDALTKLNRDGIESRLYIVGKIINNKIYKKIIANRNVIYRGPMPREELIDIYRKCDIFVLPSHTETFGLVYPEAMSQGLPLVYTKNQGFDKWFPDGHVGYAVDSKKSDEIYQAVILIMDNYSQISNNAIDGSEKFSWEKIVSDYSKVYSK